MPYVGGGGAPNPMQRAECPHCGAAAGNGARCNACRKKIHSPGVVVFDVGQGNCNALLDATGKMVALFDYGYSTSGARQPTPPLELCLCDNPLIILSHWDADHINLAKHVKKGLTMDWLVPEQGHSSFAGKVQKWIKDAGGRLHVWPASRRGVNHVAFPWGFVEHCTEPPASGLNGSGLAAFICVQNDPAGAAGVVAPADPSGLNPPVDTAPVARARLAAGAVVARVNALIPLANRPAVLRLAKALAPQYAASQTIVGRHPHMPWQQCTDAAVWAAFEVAVSGHNAANTLHQLDNVRHVNPALRAHNGGWATAALTELAAAAVAAHNARSHGARVRAAAGALTQDGSVDAAAFSWIGVAASQPAAPAMTIRRGRGPMTNGEYFVLLNGDADFQWVPSMRRTPRPKIASLTAMHHGAVFEDGHPITWRSIPVAPRSRAANAIVRFNRARAAGSMIATFSEAGRVLSRGRYKKRRRNIRVAVSRCARAAAAAVHALEAAHPGELNVNPFKFGVAAAAAAVTAWRDPNARSVGLATTLGSTTKNVCEATDSIPIEGVVELAIAAVAGAGGMGGGLTNAEVSEISKGAIDGDLVGHVHNMATATLAGAAALTPDNAGEEAATTLIHLYNSYKNNLSSKRASAFKSRIQLTNADEDVLNDLATGATAAILASAHNKHNRNSSWRAARSAGAAIGVLPAGFGAIEASVRGTVQLGTGAAPGGGAAAAAFYAAYFAGLKAAAMTIGTSCAAIRAVVGAATSPARRRHAVQVQGTRRERDRRGGRIAYSYGVDAGNSGHEYGSVVAGNCGHPHPLAVIMYEAHGWEARRNASNRARHAGLQGDPDKKHTAGSAMLAWNSRQQRAATTTTDPIKCGTCGKTYKTRG